MKVPFLDLAHRAKELRPGLDAAYSRVMASGRFIKGPEVERFEQLFADYCGATQCVGTGNGFDALSMILEAYGIGPGDEVIVPSMTYVATWLAVSRRGANPVPVEPDAQTLNIDAVCVANAITEKTRAVIAVHLYGQCAPMDQLRTLCDENGVKLIEDAAQSVGAAWGGVRCGALGDAAAFSFYPVKTLGAFGDGGAIVTSDEDLARRVRMLGNYGGLERGEHLLLGRNSRLDELQAAFLSEALGCLDDQNAARRKIAERYRQSFEMLEGIRVQQFAEPASPVYHQFVVLTEHRDRLRKNLDRVGVGTSIHYRLPPHRLPAYSELITGQLPIADEIAATTLSLPISPYLAREEVEYVAEQVASIIKT